MKKIFHLFAGVLLAFTTPLLSIGWWHNTSNNGCKIAVQPATISCPAVDCGSNVVHIRQADVGPYGYTISAPGRYCFIEDISFAPLNGGSASSPVAAITIISSNVQLDLNGYVLTGPTNVSNVVGIKVASSSSNLLNVIINNGSVQSFSLGIYVDPVNGLLLQDIAAVNNGVTGSIINGGLTFVGGIAITDGSSNVVMRRVSASNNLGVYGSVASYGALLNSVNFAVIEDCQFNSNQSINYECVGLYLGQSDNISVSNCTADGNSGATAVVGFEINETTGIGNNVFTNCSARDNVLDGVPLAPVSQNALFADGFHLFNATQCSFFNCYAIAQSSNLPSELLFQHANGFELETCFDCQFESCIATDNGFATNVTIATGFHVAGNRCTFSNCIAETNVGTTFSYGFNIENFANFGTAPSGDVIPSEDVLIGCKVYGYPLSANTYGIRLYNALTCVVEGCLLQSNAPDGILLDESAICLNQNNVIKHNQIINISTQEVIERPAAVRGLWAIEDRTNPNSGPFNYYADNYAYDYPGTGGHTNYNTGVRLTGNNIVAPTNGFIVAWLVPGSPPAASLVSKITNYDITYSSNCTG